MLWQSIPVHVRRNSRARRVWLAVRPGLGIEIVLPYRISTAEVPSILDRHRDWILERQTILAQRGQAAGQPVMPEMLHCRCISRVYPVKYREGERWQLMADDTHALVVHPPGEREQGAALLCRALISLGQRHLVPMCRQVAAKHNIAIGSVQVRNQRTRWGSCSARGDISLNAKLMLLDAALATHVMLHELCHVHHRNHGPVFKSALQDLDPRMREHELALRAAWDELPVWCRLG